MRFLEERKLLVEQGRQMLDKGLTKGSGGNLSIYLRKENLMLISPSGLDYHRTTPEDIVLAELDGTIVEGTRKPSSEFSMHSILYKHRDDINAVVHSHSVYTATLASLRWELPAAYYLIAVAGGENVRCAEYATYGTPELAQNAFKAMEGRYAALLANHGLLVGAKDIENALNKAEEIELCAEVYYRTKTVGEPVILDSKEIGNMLDRFQTYGQVQK